LDFPIPRLDNRRGDRKLKVRKVTFQHRGSSYLRASTVEAELIFNLKGAEAFGHTERRRITAWWTFCRAVLLRLCSPMHLDWCHQECCTLATSVV
jgi:hypothetical protein